MFGAQMPADGELLPWSWAEQRLTDARTYWIATTRPDGRPHTRPVWGVWLDDHLWFSTGSLARHNLVTNPAITVHPDDGDRVVVIEGRAERVTDVGALRSMCTPYTVKYDYPIHPTDEGMRDDAGNEGPVYRVVPDVVLGWDADMARPTRWRPRR